MVVVTKMKENIIMLHYTGKIGFMFFAGLLISGCGTVTDLNTKDKISNDQISLPHKVNIEIKKFRDIDPEGLEYLKYMQVYNVNTITFDLKVDDNGKLNVKLNKHFDKKQGVHYQFFIDTDNDRATGYYDPWVPSIGAEYLLEDNVLFKYKGHEASHKWDWEVVEYGEKNAILSENGITIGQSFPHELKAYFTTQKSDWTYDDFYGIRDTAKTEDIVQPYDSDMVISLSRDDNYYYIHTYKKDHSKLDKNGIYYNYKINWTRNAYGGSPSLARIEGNTYFNTINELIKNDLPYEVLDYEAVTVVPKSVDWKFHNYLTKDTLYSATIRDENWRVLDEYNSPVKKFYDKYPGTKYAHQFHVAPNGKYFVFTMEHTINNNYSLHQGIIAWDATDDDKITTIINRHGTAIYDPKSIGFVNSHTFAYYEPRIYHDGHLERGHRIYEYDFKTKASKFIKECNEFYIKDCL